MVVLVWLAYFGFFESYRGRTPGKRLMGMRTIGPSGGGHPTLSEAIRRNAWLVLLGIPVVGGFVWLAAIVYNVLTISRDRPVGRGWHDRFAGGTRVVRVG